ncbi:D-TA family PLP-dependent enzyme [Thalassobaculum sp.]|uniref:D-TA family PLP-dependent enzyme n=1 Tax=Thalassobaculum sp. TaxID=2022740 RepID=UPI0032F07C78
MNALADIDTPAVLVDLDVAEANIDRFQDYCNLHGFRNRPHIKTHKLPVLARRQIKAGAVGITCQKISEAEAMIAEGGVDDVLLTYNVVGMAKLQRLRALAGRVTLSVVADSAAVVAGLGAAFADASEPLTVLVECDTGAHRCGVATPAAARDLAGVIDRTAGARFGGLMTYPPVGGTGAVQEFMSEAIELCEAAGLAVERITSGGAPDMWRAHEAPLVTEYRTGTYVYNDRSLVERGVCTWDDCALTVLATVVSVPDGGRAIIDAGTKVLTSDLLGLDGHGHVLGRPDIRIDQLSEEHGRLVCDGSIALSVGDRVRIVPNHCCVVSNMMDAVVGVRGSRIEGDLTIAARGLVW